MNVVNKGICIGGFRAAGIRKGKYGIALIVAEDVCKSAAVFTKNRIKGAHIPVMKKAVGDGLHAIVVNSGNANACTPTALKDAKTMANIAADALGINRRNVGVASTGIIGKPLDINTVEKLINEASQELGSSQRNSKDAVAAIMTTDMKPKMISVEQKGIVIGGICKGSGMVAPNLGTMLCFLTTNAKLSRVELQDSLKNSVRRSFNMLIIDDDMSPNDTVVLLSSGKKKCSKKDFQAVLDYVTIELTKMLAADGEGATKFIEVNVTGAKNRVDAENAVRLVLSSPLVKSMIYGRNPNWGRIVSKLGSGSSLKFNRMIIRFSSGKNSALVLERGVVGDLKNARAILDESRIIIDVHLGAGKAKATGWGCDLTPAYVRINARYN